MDRVAAMLVLLGVIVAALLIMLALFSIAPIFSSCLMALLYVLYYFLADETSEIHHAQEFENRFWTTFAVLLTLAMVYVKDSPFYFGETRPWLALFILFVVGYGVHTWDRMMHRKEMSRQVVGLRRGVSAAKSLVRLSAMGMSVDDQLERISICMANIDQLLVPSTINNFINQQFILRNEREIINIFEDAHPKALNWLISHVKLALIFYKVKDHRNFRGQHRTELIELLAVDRVSVLTTLSRVLLLRALQLMKLPANPRAEHWVRNIILSTHQDDLSELKTLTDSKGDYFCMNKLIYDDIRSHTVRQDILTHFRKEAAVQQAHMDMGTRRARLRMKRAWRKVLSDVDDTLTSSGGSYPAGIDKRYSKKVVYPGVIGLYRELDLGTNGPEEFPPNTVGNLVFLSARPHLYKDVSEKHNFAKFQKLRERGGVDGRGGLHTIPSLLAGDLTSGREFMMTNDFEPLARKKFDNFKRYVSIYPEYKHVFICDNGQGDVRAGELMYDQFPRHVECLFVHVVQDIKKTYGFDAERWRRKGLANKTCFFSSYPDAALNAATRKPPLIRMRGLRRVCQDAVADFNIILPPQWSSFSQKRDRRDELNQSLWRCNKILTNCGEEPVPLIASPRLWEDGQKVRTPYGIGTIKGFDPIFDLYGIEIDWRPLDEQVKEYLDQQAANKDSDSRGPLRPLTSKITDRSPPILQTVVEEDETNYLSPATSFDASKQSSKQSVTGFDQEIRSLPGSVLEENQFSSGFDSCGEITFGANSFDCKESGSLEPSLEGTAETISRSDGANPIKSKKGKTTRSPGPFSVAANTNLKRKLPSNGKCYAKIQGRYITKYVPPSLPKLPRDDKARSKFSFWGGDSTKSKAADSPETVKTKSKPIMSPGEKVTTPYGSAVVVDHSQASGIVIVDMTGWTARAYLRETSIKREGTGFFGSFLRQFSSTSERQSSPTRLPSTKLVGENEPPFVIGMIIRTPFGEGRVSRPFPSNHDKNLARLFQTKRIECRNTKTISISLTSWTLGDGRHPILYCTLDNAIEWRNRTETNASSNHRRENSLLSVIGNLVTGTGSLVSGTVESLRSGTVESFRKIRVPREIDAPQISTETCKFERYYKDGAAVATAYGDGTICSFRHFDGFYTVSLLMKSGETFATAYLQEDSMSYRLAKGCIEGYPVLTKLGLSGVLQSVNPTTGVHNVIIPSCGAMCYLQPNQVIRPLKAAVGENVSTPYGEGIVLKYRLKDDIYEIKLFWGRALLFAKADTFDRIDDRMEDKGGFGMGWILQFFYSREESKGGISQRSRSDSYSMLSQSGRSIKSQSGRSLGLDCTFE